MIFNNLPTDLSEEQLLEIVKKRFRVLRTLIFNILPDECLLKPRRSLYARMIDLVDTPMIEQGIIEKNDICAICIETTCPHFNIRDRAERIRKLEMLNTNPSIN